MPLHRERSHDGDLEEDLPRIARRLSRYFHRDRRMIRMILFASMAEPELIDHVAQGPKVSIERLREAFASRASGDALEPHDPLALAESFVAGVFGITIGLGAFSTDAEATDTVERKCERFAALFVDVLRRPEQGSRAEAVGRTT